MKVFLSYATEDTNVFRIADIVNYLELQKDIENVFYWERDCNAGIEFHDYMVDKIKECDVVIVFCSEASAQSNPVFLEMGIAMANKKRVLPVFREIHQLFSHLEAVRGTFYKEEFREFAETLYFELTGRKPEVDPLDKTYVLIDDLLALRLGLLTAIDGRDLVEIFNVRFPFDSALLSGMTSAVLSLGEELSGTSTNRQILQLGTIFLTIYIDKQIRCILVSEKSPSEILDQTIWKVIKKFTSENDISNWNGDIRKFEDFPEKIKHFLYPNFSERHYINPDAYKELKLSEKTIKRKNILKIALDLTGDANVGFLVVDFLKLAEKTNRYKPAEVFKVFFEFMELGIFKYKSH